MPPLQPFPKMLRDLDFCLPSLVAAPNYLKVIAFLKPSGLAARCELPETITRTRACYRRHRFQTGVLL